MNKMVRKKRVKKWKIRLSAIGYNNMSFKGYKPLELIAIVFSGNTISKTENKDKIRDLLVVKPNNTIKTFLESTSVTTTCHNCNCLTYGEKALLTPFGLELYCENCTPTI